ncbi:LPS export ABC transporter permease LptF [Uliginosibacterium sp. 31-12]|uniref:LPS export ABC transporter permease LptF n=1 Tax=Uliginosibacterium sp. 31-12 TaxID=3062781 RepID=UPI0026E22037|nr:LPS export ABC transporter permease LptF [Uliginosibacterium sp. 31-12]MDO6387419.1 LPS export ABC transporter permease LptF [Uliginosibacterium sp. 31-12]
MIFRRAAMREFASTAAAIFVALFFILVTVILVRLLSQAAGGRLPADAVLALIGFSTLNHLPVTLALSVFVAVLLSLSRSYRDSEMVVWFSSGLSLTAWLRPVLAFVMPIVAVIAALSLFLSPWAQGKALEYRKRLETRDEVSRVAPGVFRESVSAQRVFFVESVDREAGKVRNVFINSSKDGRQDLTVAAEGLVESASNGDRFVVLFNGHRYEGEPGSAEYRVMAFERYAVRIEPKEIGVIEFTPRTLTTLNLFLLPSNANKAELAWRFGIPLATLLLALLAIPLSFVNPRAGRANSLIFAVLAFAVYFNLLGVSQAWIAKGKLDVLAGMACVHGGMFLLLVLLFGWRMLPDLRRFKR